MSKLPVFTDVSCATGINNLSLSLIQNSSIATHSTIFLQPSLSDDVNIAQWSMIYKSEIEP